MSNFPNSHMVEYPLEEKIDFQTNNPRKLFRSISDLFEDELSKRGYAHQKEETPDLKASGIEGVAQFMGHVERIKIRKQRTIGRILSGILFSLIMTPIYGIIISPILNTLGIPLFIEQILWGLFPLIGLIIMLSKTKTELRIEVELEGEGYRYRGNNQVNTENIEKRERLDVVSDVRLTIIAHPISGSYMNEKSKKELSSDWEFLIERLNKIVPEYRIPA